MTMTRSKRNGKKSGRKRTALRQRGSFQAEVLSASSVPVSFRPGPARGPSPEQHAIDIILPQAAAWSGLQRPLPEWLRRVRPAHDYAIKTGIHPAKVTEQNIARFRSQLKRLGFSFDWTREVNTTDPNYYKWTQWIFLKLFEHGLAYKAEIPINFCTSCKVGLANEEVVDGHCERCGGEVVQKVRSQWMLRITAYAQRLIDDLDTVDFIDRVKTQQRNWIGRSEGAEVDFALAGTDDKLRVFTTRCDTLFGATYMVMSPEHPYIEKYKDRIENWAEVQAYREAAARKSDFERSELTKEKTGVPLAPQRHQPGHGQGDPRLDFRLCAHDLRTGAIMAVLPTTRATMNSRRCLTCPSSRLVAGGDVEKEAFNRLRDRQAGQLRFPQCPLGRGSQGEDDRLAGGEGHRRAQGELQAA